ncbi:MAG: hypothetical protein HYS04_15825 [Acidobacteria bacterium]|nr:hypothetical protein [Acidobacteriota bacterium]
MIHQTSYAAAILLLAAAAPPAWPQMFHNPEPVAARVFPIMAWGGAPPDPVQLKLMKEAGLNAAGFCRVEDAGKVRDAGLACFVSDKRINGYDWAKLPPDADLRGSAAEVTRLVAGNPAVLGFYLRDEPHASLMPAMGRMAAILRELAPDKWPYVNLFPYRVSRERMGTDYETYAKMLVNTLRQPFLSYDNYSLVAGEMLDYFYNNLEIIRRVSQETNTPFWNCILANAHFNYMEPSDATFHLQVYSTLAYGGRGIQYFTWYTPHNGNYRLGAIDQFGNKTATYDALRRINLQIHALAPTMVKLRSTGVYHSPDVPEYGKPLSQSRLVRSVAMNQRYVRPPLQGRFLIGEFEDGQGRPYFMIVNKDLSHSFQFAVELKQEKRRLIRICNYSGKEEAFGREMDWLAPGAGILFRIE